jgi:hypothetical protein
MYLGSEITLNWRHAHWRSVIGAWVFLGVVLFGTLRDLIAYSFPLPLVSVVMLAAIPAAVMLLRRALFLLRISVVGDRIEIVEGIILPRRLSFPVQDMILRKGWYINPTTGGRYWVEVISPSGSHRVGRLLSESSVDAVLDQFTSMSRERLYSKI